MDHGLISHCIHQVGEEVRVTSRRGLMGLGWEALDSYAVTKMEWPSIQIREKTTGGEWIRKWFKVLLYAVWCTTVCCMVHDCRSRNLIRIPCTML
jgi:hypothetical protein